MNKGKTTQVQSAENTNLCKAVVLQDWNISPLDCVTEHTITEPYKT